MRILKILLLLAVFASLCFPAYIYGDVYRHDFEKLNETVIRVDGDFSYRLVTENANYSLFLPPGEFTLSASSFDENGNLEFYTEEKLVIGEQDQRIDLVLMPANNYLLYAGILLIFVLAGLWADSRFRSKQQPVAKPRKIELDEDAKKVLQALESFENRATQKELREELKFSDAKLSLILTELEQLGRVKKFKRGRANIVKKLN